MALVEEIRDSKYYIPELSFVAELNDRIVGHFLFSKFPLSPTKEGGYVNGENSNMICISMHKKGGNVKCEKLILIVYAGLPFGLF